MYRLKYNKFMIINSLPAYTLENKDMLIRKSILGAVSARRFSLQTGVKTKAQINLLGTNVTLQDGSACGWNAAGTSTITKRDIVAPVIKVNMSFCDKTLLNSALQHDVRIAAGQQTLPFEEKFVADVLADIAYKHENLIWKGDTSLNNGSYLDLADGLIKIGLADVTNVVGTTDALTSANIKSQVDAVFAGIDAAILDKAEIYMGVDAYRLYVMALQALNLYMGSPAVDTMETFYPGSNVKVVAVPGLTGTDFIFAFEPANAFYGTDLSGDEEKFDIWYSKDNQEFRLAVQFTSGVNWAIPAQVTMRKKA